MDILTIGDAMRDIFVFPAPDEIEGPVDRSKLDHRFSKGEKLLTLDFGGKIAVDEITYDIGGTACNVAVGLAKLGIKSGIISKAGDDNEGAQINDRLSSEGVDQSLLEIENDKKTGLSVIISINGERSILVYHSFKSADLTLPSEIKTKWLFLGPLSKGYEKIYTQAVAQAAEKGLNIAVNPGSIQINDGMDHLRSILRVAKILFVNKQEGQRLAMLSHLASARDVVRALLKTGVETVVVTDGANGAYAANSEKFLKIGIYPGERIDSTGAGDAFSAGFLAANFRGQSLFDCLKWGVTNSAAVVGKVGAQQGLLTLLNLKKKIRDYHWPPETLQFN